MKTPRFVLLLPALVACSADDDDIAVDSHAICDCPELVAADIPYDNVGSGLDGTDVQLAVDELAARPQGLADAYERIERVEEVQTSPSSGVSFFLQAACPEILPDRPVALGGACGGGGAGTSIARTELGDHGFNCYWNKPDGEAIEFTATVSCLSKAEAE